MGRPGLRAVPGARFVRGLGSLRGLACLLLTSYARISARFLPDSGQESLTSGTCANMPAGRRGTTRSAGYGAWGPAETMCGLLRPGSLAWQRAAVGAGQV